MAQMHLCVCGVIAVGGYNPQSVYCCLSLATASFLNCSQRYLPYVRQDTIDDVYALRLTGSQLCLPNGNKTNRLINEK